MSSGGTDVIPETPEYEVPDTQQLGFITESGQYRIVDHPALHKMDVGHVATSKTGAQFTMTSREDEHTWEKTVNAGGADSELVTTVISRTSAYLPAIIHDDDGGGSSKETSEIKSTGTGEEYGAVSQAATTGTYYVFTDGERWVIADEDTVQAIARMGSEKFGTYKGEEGEYTLYRHPGSHGSVFLSKKETREGRQYFVAAPSVRYKRSESFRYHVRVRSRLASYFSAPDTEPQAAPAAGPAPVAEAKSEPIALPVPIYPPETSDRKPKAEVEAKAIAKLDYLSQWLNEGIENKATFVAISTPGGKMQSMGEPRVVADIYSITKSVFGLLVAKAHFDHLGNKIEAKRFNVMDTAYSMMSKVSSNPDQPINRIATLVCGATLNDLLTQTSGVQTEEVSYKDIMEIPRGTKDLSEWAAEKVTKLRDADYADDPEREPVPFHYNNVMTQVAEFAYAFRMRQIYNHMKPGSWAKFTTKNEGMRTIFDKIPSFGGVEWLEGRSNNRMLQSTMVFMGIKLTGLQLYQLGMMLVHDAEWYRVLEFIHSWEAHAKIPEKGYPTRQGWRYAFLWWIPNEEAFDGQRYLVAIGLFGQYLVINLDLKIVAVRQHNLSARDVSNLLMRQDIVDEHPDFVQDVHSLITNEWPAQKEAEQS